MRPVPVLVMIVLVALLGASGVMPTRAQADAAERIRAAYAAYDAWDTFSVQIEDNTRYALVVEGKQYIWQTREGHATVTGWYDLSQNRAMSALLAYSGALDESTDLNGERTVGGWSADIETAVVEGDLFWRGTFDSQESLAVAVPGDWESATVQGLAAVPDLVSMVLERYVVETVPSTSEGRFMDWLDAALSIDGPQTHALTKRTQGDLYIVEVDLEAVPGVVESRLDTLARETDAIVDRDVLLDSLLTNSTFSWGVVLDPDSGALMAHMLLLDLSADLKADALGQNYATLTLAFTDSRTVTFSSVNEPVDTSGLP
ncbi:MAG: hypothetical protein JW966_12845 [Anaerolineae bacterium]|nr:hypothetical protein [Anaerolineae bacterium]